MSEHRSRFKAYLISPEQLPVESEVLLPHLLEYERAHRAGEISAPQWATLFTLLYLGHRAPAWPMKKKNSWAQEQDSFLQRVLGRVQIKKLPDSIVRTLYYWQSGEYPIHLKTEMVTSYEMLKHQARGERIVTLAHDRAIRGELVDGERDALEFLLHDLVHADLFFESTEKNQAQRGFFESVLRLVENGELEEAQKNDPQFCRDFNYLISDMNSHPAHLAAHFKASYVKHLLFCEGLSTNGQLSGHSRDLLQATLKKWEKQGVFEVSLS